MIIKFFSTDIPSIPLRNRRMVRKIVEKVFKKEGKNVESLSYIFTSDRFILDLNKKFLEHNFYTDVITFDLSDNPSDIIGEIYISIARVRINAMILRVPIKEELHRVILHGALHLCGYKDKTNKEIAIMRERENKYLQFLDV